MNELQQAICDKFGIKHFAIGRRVSVKCCYHNDSHPSAVIFFSEKAGWFHCNGCHVSLPIFKVIEGIKVSNQANVDFIEEEEVDYEEEFKPGLNPIELLEAFCYNKCIKPETVTAMNGEITEKGYLVFKYGFKGKRVGRYLGIEKDAMRFLNEGGNKGLFGEEIIHQYEELFHLEGLTDYLSMYQLGYRNLIYSFGAGLSDEQAYLLRGKTVFNLFDRDFAGYSGAKQASLKLKEFGGIPITLELYEIPGNTNKIDVNYLCCVDETEFDGWLHKQVGKYGKYDIAYLPEYRSKPKLKYYTTDISLLKMTEGLYVFTGQPGVGKTTMGISLLHHFRRQGAKVLYCNYDLPKDQIIARLQSRKSNHEWSKIEGDHSIVENKVETWTEGLLRGAKIVNGLTMDEIKYMKKFFDVMIIDYLQRIPNPDKDQRVGLEKNMDTLSNLAVDEGKVIIGISRMNVSGYDKIDGHVFSGTAAIEYHAQAAIVLKSMGDDKILCNVMKNTRGKTGMTHYEVNYGHQLIKETNLNTIAKVLNDEKGDLLY